MSSYYISLCISPHLSLGSPEIREPERRVCKQAGHLRNDPICCREGPGRMKVERGKQHNNVLLVDHHYV